MLGNESGIVEKNMFGGVSFLVKGRMACAVLNDDLVVRINPNESSELLKNPHVGPMDFTGKPMKGFLYVSAQGYETEKDLRRWVTLGLEFASTLPAKTKKKTK